MGKKILRVVVIAYIFILASNMVSSFFDGELMDYLTEGVNWEFFVLSIGLLAIAEAVDDLYFR